MTFEEKVKTLMENIDCGYQTLGEFESQYQSECAMYGDAGPGQAITIREIKAELAKQEAKLAEMWATPIGKALRIKWNKEYEAEKANDLDKDWPF